MQQRAERDPKLQAAQRCRRQPQQERREQQHRALQAAQQQARLLAAEPRRRRARRLLEAQEDSTSRARLFREVYGHLDRAPAAAAVPPAVVVQRGGGVGGAAQRRRRGGRAADVCGCLGLQNVNLVYVAGCTAVAYVAYLLVMHVLERLFAYLLLDLFMALAPLVRVGLCWACAAVFAGWALLALTKAGRSHLNYLWFFKQRQRLRQESQACAVCLEEVDGEGAEEVGAVASAYFIRTLNCGHRYHRDCISPWLEDRGYCPLCRSY